MTEVIRKNPFPSKGVIALIGAQDQKLRTVPTREFQHAAELSINYLQDGIGQAITISGPHGSGKTHLIYYCIEAIRDYEQKLKEEAKSDVVELLKYLHLYGKIENQDFVSLYKQLIKQIKFTQLRDVSRRFLGFIAKQELDKAEAGYVLLLEQLPSDEGKKGAKELMEQQQHDAKQLIDAKPEVVFDYFDKLILQPEIVLNERSQRLQEISGGGENFKRAFYYLDKEIIGEEIAYKWFLAEELTDSELLRLGVRNSLTTPDEAKHALILIAALFKYAGIRLLIFIDQVERLLTGVDDDIGMKNAGQLHTLTESFPREQCFLMLAGSNEGWSNMRKDFWERIGPTVINMEQMSSEDAQELLKLYIQDDDRYTPFKSIDEVLPFSQEAINELVNLSGGNKRRFLQTCYLAYQQYTKQYLHGKKASIDADVIRQAVFQAKDSFTPTEVKETIKSIVKKKKLEFQEDVQLAGRFKADFLLGEKDNPSAIIEITDPLYIVQELEKALDIVNFKNEIAINYPHTRFFVIAMGYISSEVVSKLKKIVDDCIVYEGEGFVDKFEILIDSLEVKHADSRELKEASPAKTNVDQDTIKVLTEKIKKELLDNLIDVRSNVERLNARFQDYSEIQKEERQDRLVSPRNIEWRNWLKQDQEKWEKRQNELKVGTNNELNRLREEGEKLQQKQIKTRIIFCVTISVLAILGTYIFSYIQVSSYFPEIPSREYGVILIRTLIYSSLFLAITWSYYFLEFRKLSPLGSISNRVKNIPDINQLVFLAKTTRVSSIKLRYCLKNLNPFIRYFGVQSFLLTGKQNVYINWIDLATQETWKPLYLAYLKAAILTRHPSEIFDHIKLISETDSDDPRLIYAISLISQIKANDESLKLPVEAIGSQNGKVLSHAIFERVLNFWDLNILRRIHHPLVDFAIEEIEPSNHRMQNLFRRFREIGQFWGYDMQSGKEVDINKYELEIIINAISPHREFGLASFYELQISSYYLKLYRFFAEIEWLADQEYIVLR